MVLAGCVAPVASRKGAMEAYQAGVLDMANGPNKTALADFSEAIKRDPKFVPAYVGRASVEISLKKVSAAMADWTTAIELDPTNETVLLTRGTVCFQLKDFNDAATDGGRVIRLNPHNANAFVLRGASRFYLDDYDEANSDLSKAISLSPGDVLAHDYRGRLRVQHRDWDGAKADFTAAIRANPDDVMAWQSRAAVEMTDKDYEAGINDASHVLQLDPRNFQGAYRLLAQGKIYLKDNAGALAEANELVALDSSNASSYFARAEIKILCDDFSGASNDMRTAVRMSPGDTSIYVYREMLEQKRREPAAALTDLNRMLALAPHSSEVPEIYEAMGHAHEELHQWWRALRDFHLAMACNSPPDGACFEAFLLQRRLEETEAAAKDLDAYIHSIPASKANDWTTSIANFLAGHMSEEEFLAQATTTAKRPTDISSQLCDAYYFEGMVHLLAGYDAKASEFFQKCINTGEDNSYSYMNAVTEVDDLKKPARATTSPSPSNHGS